MKENQLFWTDYIKDYFKRKVRHGNFSGQWFHSFLFAKPFPREGKDLLNEIDNKCKVPTEYKAYTVCNRCRSY